MNKVLNAIDRIRLENTILEVCKSIGHNLAMDIYRTEYSLRKELVACILGSQVRYEMASKALDRMEKAGLLTDEWWNRIDDEFESEVYKALSNDSFSNLGVGCYRFSKIRANQLQKTRNSIVDESLWEILYSACNAKLKRKILINRITGIGPKQASMFLRNVGMSYDLAILDTHVLDFMVIQNVLCEDQLNISTLVSYERIECIVKDYSDFLGYPVGYLDWAIWATMKAAKEMKA